MGNESIVKFYENLANDDQEKNEENKWSNKKIFEKNNICFEHSNINSTTTESFFSNGFIKNQGFRQKSVKCQV